MKSLAKILYVTICLLTIHACADLTELNEDPTKATQMNPELLIPTIQLEHSQSLQDVYRWMIYPGAFLNQWSGDWSCIEYGGKAKKYPQYMERLWTVRYPNMIKNVITLVQNTQDNENMINTNAIGRILKVEAFQKLTDYYGDIPYSEAGKIYSENIINPKYDKQEDIYHDFLSELRAASSQLNLSAPAPQYDLYYNGDINKWKRFANSLWLRTAMRLIKVDPELAKTEAKAAYNAGLMTSNDDICYVTHEASIENIGPGNGYANRLIYNSPNNRFRLSDELLDALVSVNDPRLLLIARCYFTDAARTDITAAVYQKLGEYIGLPAQEFIYGEALDVYRPDITLMINGKEETVDHYSQRLQPSKLLTDPASPYIHLSYAETEFFLAETAIRGWNISTKTAKEHYKNGLKAAIKQWELFGAEMPDEASLNDFIEKQALLLEQGETAALEEIQKQLWILYILDPIETWNNVRRTGMPSKYIQFYNRYPSENQSNGQMPRRMQYPQEEQIKNKANYEEAISRMEGDDWLNRIWWDKE